MSNNFDILITNTNRSIYYLKILKQNKLIPNNIIYLDNNKKNYISNKLKIILKNKKYNLKTFKTDNIDDVKVVNYLLNNRIRNIIYSGYPRKIIYNKKLLKNKNLIHSHSGRLPNYRGSTTIYYSILNERKIYCTTFILKPKIDSGKILLIKNYPLPKKITSIDNKYDNEIRAQNILYVIKNLNILKKKKLKNKFYLPYYVIHPVLRSVVFYGKKMNRNLKR